MKLDITLVILTIIFLFFFLQAIYLKKKIMLPYEKKQQKSYLLYFYTDWCLVSRSLLKDWENLITKMKGSIIFLKINGNNHPNLCSKLNISDFPSFIYFKNNKIRKYEGKLGFKYLKKILLK